MTAVGKHITVLKPLSHETSFSGILLHIIEYEKNDMLIYGSNTFRRGCSAADRIGFTPSAEYPAELHSICASASTAHTPVSSR